MARIYQARQRIADKRYDFTVSSDEERWCHPIGYCVGWEEIEKLDAQYRSFSPGFSRGIPDDEREKRLRFRSKFHSDGHATAEEAERCHREYELDFETYVYEDPTEARHCDECGKWTTQRVKVGVFKRFVLCDEHGTAPFVAKHFLGTFAKDG